MKSLEELANWSTGDLPDLLTKVILAEVEEAARARRFGRNLVTINEDLVRTKGRSLIFYKRGTLTASAVTEGSTPDSSTVTYSPVTLTVSKYAVAAKITQEAIDGSRLDLIRDTIRETGIAHADKEDKVIVACLLDEESTITVEVVGSGGTITLGHSPLTWIELTAGAYTFSVNYNDGIITTVPASNTLPADAATVSYYWSSRENVTDAATEGTFSYIDVINAANVIRGKKWSPDFMLIHPAQMSMLLKNSQFVDASKYGAREPLLRGEIGMISGLRVLVSTNMRQGNAILIASKRAARLAIKRHIDLKRWDNPSTDSIELYFYAEYGAKVTDEDAVCILVGLDRLTIS